MSIISFKLNKTEEFEFVNSEFKKDFLFDKLKEPIKANISIADTKINDNPLVLNTLVIPAKQHSNKLVVFLQNGGRKKHSDSKDVPIMFSRWSYGFFADYNVLCIEDPMYKIYPQINTAWYYGDKKFSILQEIVDIIKSICSNSKIENSNIIFIGSSAGGYASLYLADYINGSNAIAMNPQIKLLNWGNVSLRFQKLTNINLADDDKEYHRNDLCYVAKNKLSNFYIYVNLLSQIDNEQQIQNLISALNLQNSFPKNSGAFNYNNFHFLLSEIDILNSHSSKLNASQLAILTDNIFHGNYNDNAANKIIEEVTDYWLLRDNYKYYVYWINVIKKIKLGSLNIVNIKLNTLILNNEFCSIDLEYYKKSSSLKLKVNTANQLLFNNLCTNFTQILKDKNHPTLYFSFNNNEKIFWIESVLNAINKHSKNIYNLQNEI